VPDFWVDGATVGGDGSIDSGYSASDPPAVTNSLPPSRPPQVRAVGEPEPAIASDGSAVVRYPFELRSRGNTVRLTARVEVMSSDGGQVEGEAPMGSISPSVRAWIDPLGTEYIAAELEVSANDADGRWEVEVALLDDAMMRVDLKADAI
jgi:hypothetical protein